MRYGIQLFALVLIIGGCELPSRNETVSSNQNSETKVREIEDEEYVMISTAIAMPMYMNRDQRAFKRWGEKMGVKVSILGPADWDVPAQINTIEEVIGTRPTGLLINGTDPAIAQVINKAVDAGIPTVVYDSNIPNGTRLVKCKGKKWLN
jgi:ribose transport system substrate-binding protein